MTTDPTRDRMIGRFRLLTVWVPAALTAVAVIVIALIAPSLPSPVAIHWNVAGEADGFAPLWVMIIVTVAAGFGLPALLGLTSLPALRSGDQGGTYRFLAALAVGLSVLIGMLSTWSLLLQRDLQDAAQAPTLTPAVLVSSLVALAAGVGGWFLQPRTSARLAQVQEARPIALDAGQEAAWVRTATLSGRPMALIGASIVALLLGTIAAWALAADRATAWSLTAGLVLVLIAVACTTAFRVRVGNHGLTVTSLIGVPRFRVPITDIVGVAVAQVNPMGEFGGVGLRLAPGRFGVVLRTGEAISVRRHRRREFVVTVDDAATAVAVLSAYQQRAKAGG